MAGSGDHHKPKKLGEIRVRMIERIPEYSFLSHITPFLRYSTVEIPLIVGLQ